jgi:predicted dehydrogenase
VPKKVFSCGVEENGAVQYLTTQYLYGQGGPAVTCSSGALAQKGRPFVHGFEIYLEKATLVYESGATPLTVLSADGKCKQPKLRNGSEATRAFTSEIQAAVQGIKAGHEPDLLSGKLARDALVLCQKECESVRTGQSVAIG